MSDLTTGGQGMPANWGAPNPVYNYRTGKYVTGGMIWFGDNPVSWADLAALTAKFGVHVHIDHATLCGKKDPAWTSFDQQMRHHPDFHQHVVLGHRG